MIRYIKGLAVKSYIIGSTLFQNFYIYTRVLHTKKVLTCIEKVTCLSTTFTVLGLAILPVTVLGTKMMLGPPVILRKFGAHIPPHLHPTVEHKPGLQPR